MTQDAGRRAKLEKLKKMYRQAESAKQIGSEAEASAFAEQMQRLLTEYRIDASELEDKEEATDIVVESPEGVRVRRRRIKWIEDLAVIVSQAHYCRLLVVPKGSSKVSFVGRRSDVDAAKGAYEMLVNAAEQIADREYVRFFYEGKREGRAEVARGYRESFLEGFVARIGHRYVDNLQAIRAYYAHSKVALAKIEHAFDAVDDYVKGKYRTDSGLRQLESRVSNRQGYFDGKKVAEKVDLNTSKARLE